MKRTLSVNFERAVSGTRAETVEIVVTPLNWANSPAGDVTVVESKQVQKLSLTNAVNTASFQLTPTYDVGLDQPIFYRIAWRRGYLGRVTETDFSMPDQDVDFDDLFDLGNVITGENYLRESDLGVPGRIARLNDSGEVVDASGTPVVNEQVDAALVRIDQEVRDRQSADASVRRDLTLRLETQVNSLSNTMDTRFASEADSRNAAIAVERTDRQTAITTLTARVDSDASQNSAKFSDLGNRLDEHTTALATKADLVGGKVPSSQLPAIALGTSVAVADEAAMLALTREQVQPGDVAVRQDGTFMLVGEDPSVLANWSSLIGMARVASVNGQTGAVVLGAADVGARGISDAISQSDVTGLVTALSGKASTSSVTSLDTKLTGRINTTDTNVTNLTGRVSTAEERITTLDGQAVKKTASGEVDTAMLASDVPRVDADNVLRRKDGTIIAVAGGSGTGAVDSVNGKIGTVVLTATDVQARPSGTPVPIADVDGLSAALASKATNVDLQQTNTRVSRLETDVADLKATGGGTGTSSAMTVSWVADNPTTPSLVTMKSPFGIDPAGEPYYDPAGSLEGEAAYPYVSRTGALVLRKLDPNAAPEPEPATLDQLNDLDARVTTLEANPTGGYSPPEGGIPKADLEQAVQDSLTAVEASTDTASGSTLVKRSVAGTFSVSEPTATTHPATKLYVDNGLSGKASTASVDSLTTTVNSKANQSDLTALSGRVTQTENALPNKADLDTSSLVPVNQIPTLPGTKVTGFNLKADLDGAGGKLKLAQVPTGIPQASIENLSTTLAGKADLVNGKVPTAQIPALATQEVQTVANRAAMLALTTTQVQRGDLAVITGTADQGTYILNADDPSVWGNWVMLQSPAGTVTSVNGQTGIVVLSAADVSARPTGVSIPQADVTNLTTDLAARATTTYVNDQVATRTTPAQVTSQLVNQNVSKFAVDYVATAAVTLSGSQSIDGTLVGATKRVLLTAQASSAQNGIWVVQSGAWTRPTDMPAGGTFLPASLVVVKSGAQHADSLWQMTTTTSGTVDTNAQAWAKIMRGGLPKTYTQGNGVTIDASNVIAAKPGYGIVVTAEGIGLDTAVALRKAEGDVPAGSTVATLPHNLGTRAVLVQVYENSSGNRVDLGDTRADVNNVTVEFAAAPAAGQYHYVIVG